MRGEWSRHDPLVVWFVELLVNHRVMEAAVYPIDPTVRKHEEQRELNPVVRSTEEPEHWVAEITNVVVDEAVASNFGHEKRGCKDGHYWH